MHIITVFPRTHSPASLRVCKGSKHRVGLYKQLPLLATDPLLLLDVRTSLSPDLVLRQRTKRIREILRGSGHDEIIEISSDSDTEAAPRRSDGRVGHALPLPHETRRQTAPPAPHPSTFPKATRTIIDLTRDFEEPLPRRKRARTIPIQTYRVPPRRTRLPDISVVCTSTRMLSCFVEPSSLSPR